MPPRLSPRALHLGLVVNPVAGIGGEAGLGGSDGAEIQAEARRRGSLPRAHVRTVRALAQLGTLLGADGLAQVRFSTGEGELGKAALEEAGFPATVVHTLRSGDPTSAEDTVKTARRLQEAGVDLLLFAGGDGTARDVFRAVGSQQLTLGIPAGVKMHSAVFAVTPEDAARIVHTAGQGRAAQHLAEVVDIDEGARRRGLLNSQLYGQMLSPRVVGMQAGKRSTAHTSTAALDGIAAQLADRVAAGVTLLLGPGTTVQEIGRRMGVEPSLLGVDVLREQELVGTAVSADQLAALTAGSPFAVVVSPIGGQGIILGRGNQQLDARVLERLAREDLLVVSTPEKLAAFAGRPLVVDAPTAALNERFRGHLRVWTGYRDQAVVRIG